MDTAAIRLEYQYVAGEQHAPKEPHRQENRRFPFSVAVYVVEGAYYVEAEGRRYCAGKGEAVVVPENRLHHIEMEAPGILDWAHFGCRLFGSDLFAFWQAPRVVTGAPAACIGRLAGQLARFSPPEEGGKWPDILRRRAAVDQAVAALTECLLSSGENETAALPPAWLLQVQRYVQDHIGQPVRLPELAACARLSVPVFCRAFKAAMGRTAMEYVTEEKLRAACRLLLAGARVNEAARAAGFSDPLYFSKVFRRSAGCPPSRYRQAMARHTP